MKTVTKTTRKKSALPIYGAAALVVLFSLILPIYKLWACLLTAGFACAGFCVLRLMFPDKVTTVTETVLTGDPQLDERIRQAQTVLERFRSTAASASDQGVSAAISRITTAAEGIIDEVCQDASDRGDTFTFFSYYLPTMDKLLTHYVTFASLSGENAVESRKRIEGCLDMVANAFEKFLDKLYHSEAVEIKASVDVLKMMLRSDGLAGKPDAGIDELEKSLQNEQSAEQAQLAQTRNV